MEPHIAKFPGQRVHMIGIGGSSMSGLAEMLQHEGYIVTGSDANDSYASDKLRGMGIPVAIGHYPEEIDGAALVIYSAAIHEEDAERVEAERLNIPQMERAVLLGQLMEGYRETVCVCGTHGKTTTSAMIAQTLLHMGMDPTVHIGGQLDALGGSTLVGARDVFVAEACEFNRSFLNMKPTIAVCLNIEEDHLDSYGDMEHLEEAFFTFFSSLPDNGLVIGNAEDERVMRLLERLPRRAETFGIKTGDWRAEDIVVDALGLPSFRVTLHGKDVAQVHLNVAGDFSIMHALAALASVRALGGDMAAAAENLSHFAGAHRRFEHTGFVQGMKMYHDYGHNPAEMHSALSVAKMQKRRVIAVMQPHTYSRVISQFDRYLDCTKDADVTLVTDIYGAREKDPGTINSRMLVDGMRKNGIDAHLTPTFDDAEQWLLLNGQENDLVLTMGCGNINLLNDAMQRHWDAQYTVEGK